MARERRRRRGGRGGSGSELSRQVSAVDARAELEKLQMGEGRGNGHAGLNGKAMVGLGIDARKGSLKEGSDEDEGLVRRVNGRVWGGGEGYVILIQVSVVVIGVMGGVDGAMMETERVSTRARSRRLTDARLV